MAKIIVLEDASDSVIEPENIYRFVTTRLTLELLQSPSSTTLEV
jgi:hypothetical protein